jgi:hypothetical protein
LVFDGGQKSAKKFEQKEAKVTKEPTGLAFRDVRQQHNVGRTREQKATRFPSSVNDNFDCRKIKGKINGPKNERRSLGEQIANLRGKLPPAG